ncbi:MAG: PAS domain-containing protein [Actinobacteria bacterium]|nr:PAS domain-containing protein [Actinomycetota bacterium]
MAVAVDEPPNLVLDEDYRIVEVGPAAEAALGPLRGRNLWDAFPGSRPLFHPYYDKARRTGEPVEFVQFYDGDLGHIRAVPEGSRLLLFWELLHRLDILTLEGLRASLDQALALIEEFDARLRRDRVKSTLRVVEGGR